MKRTRTRSLVAAIALIMLASSCSGVVLDDGQLSFVDEDAQLLCDQVGSVILAAQAVPTASHVPCVEAMPAGWKLEGTDYRSDGVTIRFESSRAPIADLTVEYSASCVPASTVLDTTDSPLDTAAGATITSEPTTHGQIAGIRLVVAGDQYCADFDIEMEANEAITLDDFPTWQWIPRAQIDGWITAGTDTRLRLDP